MYFSPLFYQAFYGNSKPGLKIDLSLTVRELVIYVVQLCLNLPKIEMYVGWPSQNMIKQLSLANVTNDKQTRKLNSYLDFN